MLFVKGISLKDVRKEIEKRGPDYTSFYKSEGLKLSKLRDEELDSEIFRNDENLGVKYFYGASVLHLRGNLGEPTH